MRPKEGQGRSASCHLVGHGRRVLPLRGVALSSDFEAHIQKPYIGTFSARAPICWTAPTIRISASWFPIRWTPKVTCIKTAPPRPPSTFIKKPKDGKANELREALLSLVKPTKEEAGYISYNIYEENDGSLFLYESMAFAERLGKAFPATLHPRFQKQGRPPCEER